MKTKLTLQEKLRDLRDEKKMTLSDLSGETNIPLSTLQRIEGQDDIRTGYQDVAIYNYRLEVRFLSPVPDSLELLRSSRLWEFYMENLNCRSPSDLFLFCPC